MENRQEITMPSDETISRIVKGIFDDVMDRRGIKQAFYDCDDDIIQEIKDSWFDIIKKTIEGE